MYKFLIISNFNILLINIILYEYYYIIKYEIKDINLSGNIIYI